MTFKTPVSILVLIYTSDLEVLLLERADKSGFWQSVTGSIEPQDKSLMDTAIREVKEETGIDAMEHELTNWNVSKVYDIYPHWRYRYAPEVSQNTEHHFGLKLSKKVNVTLSPLEHTRYEWVDWKEAAKRVFSWTNVDALIYLGQIHGLELEDNP